MSQRPLPALRLLRRYIENAGGPSPVFVLLDGFGIALGVSSLLERLNHILQDSPIYSRDPAAAVAGS